MVYVYKKNEKETTDGLIKRFTRKVQQSGVLMHVRRNRFDNGTQSKIKRREEALYKKNMKKEVDKLKKLGRFDNDAFKELKKKLKKEK
ncbi:MAG: 30S ribosomal protein S21 [Candidatus Moranbacteria bacterium]|nr:30S ribosomal protein S21 [Candidatus Moranbacteria bacterium]